MADTTARLALEVLALLFFFQVTLLGVVWTEVANKEDIPRTPIMRLIRNMWVSINWEVLFIDGLSGDEPRSADTSTLELDTSLLPIRTATAYLFSDISPHARERILSDFKAAIIAERRAVKDKKNGLNSHSLDTSGVLFGAED